jgi:hypothetical protein
MSPLCHPPAYREREKAPEELPLSLANWSSAGQMSCLLEFMGLGPFILFNKELKAYRLMLYIIWLKG